PKAAKSAPESSSHGGGHGAAPAAPAASGHGSAAKSPQAAIAKPPVDQGPRPLPRPATSADTDRITQMAAALQQQQTVVKKREDQLLIREKNMELIHQEV